MTIIPFESDGAKISFQGFDFVQVRVFGMFIGHFGDLAIALGVEAKAVMDFECAELFAADRADADNRYFTARATIAGVLYERFTARIEGVFTGIFDEENSLDADSPLLLASDIPAPSLGR